MTGADRENTFDQARQAYVAGRLAGQDTLLMAYTREDCRELSRQIRDDLVHLGLVDDGPSVRLTFGAEASAGEKVVCPGPRSPRTPHPPPNLTHPHNSPPEP